jgi:hypothetical protein
MATRSNTGGIDFDNLIERMDEHLKNMDKCFVNLDENESFNRIFDGGQAEFNQKVEKFETHEVDHLKSKLRPAAKAFLFLILVGLIITFSLSIEAIFFYTSKKVSSDINVYSRSAVEETVQPNSLKKL